MTCPTTVLWRASIPTTLPARVLGLPWHLLLSLGLFELVGLSPV